MEKIVLECTQTIIKNMFKKAFVDTKPFPLFLHRMQSRTMEYT
jgi:hypothetical protein